MYCQKHMNVREAIVTQTCRIDDDKGSSWYLCSSYCSKIWIQLANESKNTCSQFDCRGWLGKSSQTLKMLSGKLRSCNWAQFLDKRGKYWAGLLIHQSSLWGGLNISLEVSKERSNFLPLPVGMITIAYPAWREETAVINYLSVAFCKKDMLWLIVELVTKWFPYPKRLLRLKYIAIAHQGKTKTLLKDLRNREQDPSTTKKNHHLDG